MIHMRMYIYMITCSPSFTHTPKHDDRPPTSIHVHTPTASFLAPPSTTYEKYIEHVDRTMAQDTPVAFGSVP